MINPLHLLWIVPLSMAVGVIMMALCVAAGKEIPMDNDEVIYDDEHQYSGLLTDDED